MGKIVCHSWKLTTCRDVLCLCYSSMEINESYSFLRVACKLYVTLNIPDISINKVKISVLSNLKLVYTTKALSKSLNYILLASETRSSRLHAAMSFFFTLLQHGIS